MKRAIICLIIIILIIPLNLTYAKNKSKDLPKRYRDWFEKEVVYIITPMEKRVFLLLKTDRERDVFMKAFWKQRDPNPNTEENEFKIEHYKRIEYANRWYGHEAPGPGWRSDMGRIHIILGQANQIDRFTNKTGMYPTIIWFYSGKVEYGLPNSFNVVFFKRDGMGEYVLYSPVKYGPAGLLTNYMGDVLDYTRAYNELYEIEPIVARTSLTLIPSESRYAVSPSISSELLIASKIPHAPTKKVNDSYADKILKYRGIVKVEQIINYIDNHSMVKVFKDKSGTNFVHYLIEPKKLSLERYEGYLYTNLEINGRVTDMNNRTIYQFTKKIPIKLEVSKLKNIQNKLFSFQDMFPLIKGNYKYNILLMNTVSKEFTSTEGDLIVSDINGPQMSSIILANRAIDNIKYKGRLKPFVLDDIQLVPSPRNDFNSIDTLFIWFQIKGLSSEFEKNGTIKYKIIKDKDKKIVFSMEKNIRDYKNMNFLEKVPLKNFLCDYYSVKVSVYNENKNEVLEENSDFYIAPLKLRRPWILFLPMSKTYKAEKFNVLGNQYFNKKDFKQAKNFFEKSFSYNPLSLKYAIDFCRVLLKLREYSKIEQIAKPFLAGAERNKFLLIKARALHGLKKYQEAINFYGEYLTHLGMNINVLNALSHCYLNVGNKKEAIKILEMSLQEDPKQEKIKNLVLKLKEGNYEKKEKKK
jgi:GWxTD domain-containing protein